MKVRYLVCVGLFLGLFAAAGQAGVIDVSESTPSPNAANGALFFHGDPRATGTGFVDPFLRLQHQGVETGVNSGIKDPPYDDKAGLWTHELLVSALLVIKLDGTDYYQFVLDANQNSGNADVRLTDLRIFLSPTAFTSFPDDPLTFVTSSIAAGYQKYALGTGNSVIISGMSGSGSGDMSVFIPVANFGANPTGYLYLYSVFGDANDPEGHPDAGFEEWWAVLGAPANVPEPGTLGLLGLGLAGLGLASRRRKAN